jgi:hypothetical protein
VRWTARIAERMEVIRDRSRTMRMIIGVFLVGPVHLGSHLRNAIVLDERAKREYKTPCKVNEICVRILATQKCWAFPNF